MRPGLRPFTALRYILAVSSSLTPDEIRAAAATHRELGPEYQQAVVESFLDKVNKEIDARVDARIASQTQGQVPQPVRQRSAYGLAIASMVLGIPLTAVALANAKGNGLAAVVVIWIAITLINLGYSRRHPEGH
jgi:hypothetical protein